MESPVVYIPMDRRQALTRGETLPNRSEGAVLFADVSGFTPLTETLAQQFGPRRGADEITQQLNLVFDALIAEVHRYRGSVVGFSGDAITCWFGHDLPADDHPVLRATACALALQQAMDRFANIEITAATRASLAIKVAVAAGPVRRFIVGEPHIQYIDVLAGITLSRMALAEQQAGKGEVIVGPQAIAKLGDRVEIAEWRQPVETGPPLAIVTGLAGQVEASPWLPLPSTAAPVVEVETGAGGLAETQIRPWLLPPIYERLKAGRGRFLAELRTGVTLFLRFGGLDYDRDDTAGEKLDAYIRWVQRVLRRYESYLLQLTIGDKGNFLYTALGAPLAHGNDAIRAVAAALELRSPPAELKFIGPVQIGLSQGRLRAGAYGGSMRRTYGVLGDEVNVAARLMSKADPGQILISQHVVEAAEKSYRFQYLAAISVKGKQQPIPVFEILAKRLSTPLQPTALIGREEALTQLEEVLDSVMAGQGQVLRLEGVAGVGKSHLAADFVELAISRGFQVTRSVCPAPEQATGYGPWRQIFQTWFELIEAPLAGQAPADWLAAQLDLAESFVKDINPDWLPLLPLLGDLLGLPIPDTLTTTTITDPLLEQGLRFAVAIEIIHTWAENHPSLLIIEDAHWSDEASQALTLALARTIAHLPLLLAVVHRSPAQEDKPLLPELNHLPYYNHLNLHGKAEPVALHRPAGPSGSNGPQPPPQTIIGRVAERTMLANQLHALVDSNTGGVIVIEGEAGIGKSRLVADLLEQARRMRLTTLTGAGDVIEQTTPYYAWRSVFRRLFNLDTRPEANTVARRTQVLSLLQTAPQLLPLLPLLNAVLPLNLQENETTRPMSGQVRADNTHELLINLLQMAVIDCPLLLILEDAHWLDSASWALTRLVSRRLRPMLLVLVTRPLAEPVPPEYRQLLQAPNTRRLRLEPLPTRETLRLVCQRLGVISLPEPVAALIEARAEGHPFFSEELAYALRDAGLIRIADRECRLAPDVEDLSAIALPDTVEEVITSRIDRLASAHQLTLKVASVIGRVFAFSVLSDVHPIETDKPQLPLYLNTLERLDLTRIETLEPDLAYIFKHVITQEVAYNLLLFSQRRELHRAIAEWLERTYADNLPSFYPLLAHHWSHALGPEQADPLVAARALEYLELAGEQALHQYANREAVSFLTQALALEQRSRAADLAARLRRARWEGQLGEAYMALGHFAESRQHLSQALALLDRPIPTTFGKLIVTLAGQVFRQGLHRLWPRRFVKDSQDSSSPTKTDLAEAALAYEHLAEIYIFSQRESDIRLLVANAALQSLNLAEQAGPSPQLIRAYAGMLIAAGLVPWHSLAELYRRRALKIAQSIDQPAALGWVLMLSGVYNLGVGRWLEAEQVLGRAVKIFDQLGDRYRWAQAQLNLAKSLYYRGQFVYAAELAADVYTVARRHSDYLAQAWGLYQQGENKLRLGQIDEAITFLEAALLAYQESPDQLAEPVTYGLLALARLRRGEPELARQAAKAAEQILAQSSIDVFVSFQAYAGIVEVYLALWEAGITPESVPFRSDARQILKAFWKLARIYPISRPQVWLWQGLYSWLAGNPRKAHRAWHKSLTEAERLAMPYEQGLAHYEIGRRLAASDPARRAHLDRAREIFTALAATHDLARLQAATEESRGVGEQGSPSTTLRTGRRGK